MKVYIVWTRDDHCILAVCDSREKAEAKAEWLDENDFYSREDAMIKEVEVE